MGLVHPGPPEAFTLELKKKYNIRQFVETGTFMGKTAVWASQYFHIVHTIEASLDLYQNCRNNFGNIGNINFIMGDSKRKLTEVVQQLDEPAIFWLDAHYSGDETYGIGSECPLLDEISVINESEHEHFILIDDARIFLAPPPLPHDKEQWPDINSVLNLLNLEGRRYSIIFEDVILSVPLHAKDYIAAYYQNLTAPQAIKTEDIQPTEEELEKEIKPERVDLIKEIIDNKLWKEGKPLKLHLGCGEQHFNGYINIDYPPTKHDIMNVKADVFADITKINLPDNTVDEIRLHHVFEHFSRVGALALLIRWHKWLKTGGLLYIETPDFEGSAKTFLATDKWNIKTGVIRHLAGDQVNSWAYHIDHWFPERFKRTLNKLGFGEVQTKSVDWRHEPYLSSVHAMASKTRNMGIEELLTAADEILRESTVADSEKPSHDAWKKQLREIVYNHAEMPKPYNNHSNFNYDVPLAAQPVLAEKGSKLPLDEIHNFNQRDRDKWVIAKAKTVPENSWVLDIGAGTCPYGQYFSHCNYKTHDFKKYHGVMLGNTTEYGHIDYESDIINLPVDDASFDYILCTEVLEHVPEPIKALAEMTRILKPGGKMFLTAPLGSGLHQLPYHYYGGYTPEWYKHFAELLGLTLNEIVPNGGYFKLLAQENARLSWTWEQHKNLHGDKAQLIYHLFGEWLPRYLFYLEDNCFIDQFTVGYHVELQKPGNKQIFNKPEKAKEEAEFRDINFMLNLAKEEAGKKNYEKAFRLAMAVLAAEPENNEALKIISGE